MMRFVAYWAAAGTLTPIAIIVVAQLQGGVFWWPRLAISVWPSSIILMATYEREFTIFGLLALVASIAVNTLLYSIIGAISWPLFSRLFR